MGPEAASGKSHEPVLCDTEPQIGTQPCPEFLLPIKRMLALLTLLLVMVGLTPVVLHFLDLLYDE